MIVEIDKAKCLGYANCVMTLPELFKLGEDGLAVVLHQEPDSSVREQVKKVVRLCPTGAVGVQQGPTVESEVADRDGTDSSKPGGSRGSG